MIQSTPIRKSGYQGIDAAKTAKIIKFESFPEVNKKIKKSAGTSRSRMPWFYKFSRNQRGDNDGKSYLKPNKSTMNRICAQFDSVPNINMKLAGLPPFNWQMLLREDVKEYNIIAIRTFCDMDQNLSANIMANKTSYMDDKVEILDYDAIAENIVHALNEKGVTLEEAYPSVTKYLFTGENMDRVAHKQMYWRVFGDIAVAILKENLNNYYTCENCGMRIPMWAYHTCSKDMKGFLTCVDCGKVVERKGPKQCRCAQCEKEHRALYVRQFNKKKRGKNAI